jgi:23S rRNA (guanosine2251-2'-O)-methyltransferase
MIIYGINPVLEALRAGRVKSLWTSGRDDERMRQLIAFAATHGLSPQRVTADVLTRKANGGVHQGVVADVDDASDYGVADLVNGARDVPLILVLDGIEDPHNLGAILRSADATGVDGVSSRRVGRRRARASQRRPRPVRSRT